MAVAVSAAVAMIVHQSIDPRATEQPRAGTAGAIRVFVARFARLELGETSAGVAAPGGTVVVKGTLRSDAACVREHPVGGALLRRALCVLGAQAAGSVSRRTHRVGGIALRIILSDGTDALEISWVLGPGGRRYGVCLKAEHVGWSKIVLGVQPNGGQATIIITQQDHISKVRGPGSWQKWYWIINNAEIERFRCLGVDEPIPPL